MRPLTMALVGAIACIAYPRTVSADCGTVSITEMDWASARLVTAISAFLMREGYGCEVAVVPSSTVPALVSIAENGEPDIATEIWPNNAAVYEDLTASGRLLTLATVLSDGGVEGWWIPAYLAAAHPALTTIEGVLANPDLVGGRFHNCAVGWGCRIFNDNLIRALNLEDHGIDVFNHTSVETLATSVAAAHADQAPWFGYYWGPSWILGRYPMVQVDVGPYVPEIHACNATVDCATPGITSYPPSRVITTGTADFVEREPEIAALMSNISFTNQRMSELLSWQQANKASASETATHYLTTYSDEWSVWLSDAARERLSTLLP